MNPYQKFTWRGRLEACDPRGRGEAALEEPERRDLQAPDSQREASLRAPRGASYTEAHGLRRRGFPRSGGTRRRERLQRPAVHIKRVGGPRQALLLRRPQACAESSGAQRAHDDEAAAASARYKAEARLDAYKVRGRDDRARTFYQETSVREQSVPDTLDYQALQRRELALLFYVLYV